MGRSPSLAPRRRDSREGGFVLAMVVMMLFAIAVAGSMGYMVVNSEFSLANSNRDGQEALAVARGGLERFIAEQLGQVGDSVYYALGDGIALVTSRKLAEEDSLNHLYYIRSEATVADARYPDIPAKRAVGAYAWHRLNPIPLKGAVWASGGQLRLYNSAADANGFDHATTLDCAGGGTAGTAGVFTAGSVRTRWGGSYRGNPRLDDPYNFNEWYDSVSVRWDILSDASFPVDYSVSPSGPVPPFASLPSDSFPVTRVNGNLSAWDSWSGRGVLIVTDRLRTYSGFEWDGIILAGELSTSWGSPAPVFNGMVIGGLNSRNRNVTVWAADYNYHSCNAYKANAALSYLELVENTLFEVS